MRVLFARARLGADNKSRQVLFVSFDGQLAPHRLALAHRLGHVPRVRHGLQALLRGRLKWQHHFSQAHRPRVRIQGHSQWTRRY